MPAKKKTKKVKKPKRSRAKAKKVKKAKPKAISKKTIKKPIKRLSAASSYKRRFNIALRNLILFVVLFILSFILYTVSGSAFYQNLFFMLSVILGFIAVAFLSNCFLNYLFD